MVSIAKSMPETANPEYVFVPNDMNPACPISPDEFRLRFYECYRGGEKRHRHHFRNCRKQARPKRDCVDLIPKRRSNVVEDSDETDRFWGLLAVEYPAFWIVATYQVLFITGPFVFWILWLSVFGQKGDWQNASVPVLVALGLMTVFWFPFLHSSRDKLS